jgi:hypothetical protein
MNVMVERKDVRLRQELQQSHAEGEDEEVGGGGGGIHPRP